MAEKTEQPTPRRLAEARRKGQVAKSTEICTAAGLVVAFWVLGPLMGNMVRQMTQMTRQSFAGIATMEMTRPAFSALWMGWARHVGLAVLPFFVIIMIAGVVSNIGQTGLLLSFETLKPSFSRLNPFGALRRICSARGAFDLLKAVVKCAIIGGVAYDGIRKAIELFLSGPQHDLYYALHVWGKLALDLALRTSATLMALAVADYLWQRREWLQGLRMTRQEVIDDMRQSEGNPQMRSRLRRQQRMLAQSRMMADVPHADAVITNPVHVAVAIKYDMKKMRAPVVVAKGQRLMAERIKETAREHRVPLVANPPLARALYRNVEIGNEIPVDLYDAVAGVLAFVYSLKKTGVRR
ncbi:MAG: flagellar biosynthesis protein FlhB [Anaerolineae bacterium]|jgi:flagellar biosynthetic protein FlhB